MRLLLDTRVLLWTIVESRRLSAAARALIGEPDNELTFSSASLWEVGIKAGRGRDDFRIDVSSLRRSLFDN
jgi:PIN domain nuclease of toxin-antitoxin system